MIRKTIIKFLLFGLFIYFFLFALESVFDHWIPKNTNRKPYWIFSKTEQVYDYAVLGSSRTFTGIIPDTLIKYTNSQTAINLSLNGTTYPELYYVLKKFLEQNKVKHLILISDIYTVDNNFLDNPIHPYFYMPFIGNKDINTILKTFYPVKFYFWRWVPFVKYAEYNDYIGWRTFLGSFFVKGKSPFEKSKGYQLNPGTISEERIRDIRKHYPQSYVYPDSIYIDYFNKIIDLCKMNNTTVTLVNTPEYYRIYEYQKNRDDLHRLYDQIALEKEVEMLWWEDSIFCKDKSNFKDITHLNSEGAAKYTKALADLINEKKRILIKN